MSAVSKQQDKGSAFRAMHAGDPFVIPNPWDTGSPRVLEALGFTALATTSSGFAFTLGLVDGRLTLDQMAQHVAAIDAATDLPVSADPENGYGPSPADAAEAIRRVASAGAVGGSIEDFDRESRRLYEIGHAAERIRAAVDAAHDVPFPFTLTARAENHIRGNADLADTIRRLRSFEEAGAGGLYAPGVATIEETRALCDAVSKPVNVLAIPGLSVAETVEAGAQRVSVGGSRTRVAVKAFADAASAIRDRGDVSALDAWVPLDDWFRD